MNLNKLILLLLAVLHSLNSSAQITYLKNEKMFGTEGQGIFHQYAVPNVNIDKDFDGIILSFEKIDNKKICGSKRGFNFEERQNVYDIDYQKFWMDKFEGSVAGNQPNKHYKQISKWNKKILDQKKSLVLTHWLNYSEGDYKVAYNIYNTNFDTDKEYNLYQNTKSQFDEIKKIIGNKISTGGYTHVLLMCTGWNNDQFKSIARYNNWLTVTKKAANEKGELFKPYFIGITWPSYWFNSITNKSMVDLYNKANDADELGMTHINYFLWQTLVPTTTQSKIPLILIGHSFGARILTRASNSAIYFKNKVDSVKKIDAMIAFQGAYSLDRHLDYSTSSGAFKNFTIGAGLYIVDKPVRHFTATSSANDGAINSLNFPVFLGLYIGGKKGYQYIADHNTNDYFKLMTVSKEGFIDLENHNSYERLYLNADNIIVEDHGDVSNLECGNLIWQLIKNAEVTNASTAIEKL